MKVPQKISGSFIWNLKKDENGYNILHHDYDIEREDFSEGYKIPSIILVCPICMSTWAKLSIIGSWFYVPQLASCESCNWSSFLYPVPGSLLNNDHPTSGVDWALLEALPLDLLIREFNLTLKAVTTWLTNPKEGPPTGTSEHSTNTLMKSPKSESPGVIKMDQYDSSLTPLPSSPQDQT